MSDVLGRVAIWLDARHQYGDIARQVRLMTARHAETGAMAATAHTRPLSTLRHVTPLQVRVTLVAHVAALGLGGLQLVRAWCIQKPKFAP